MTQEQAETIVGLMESTNREDQALGRVLYRKIGGGERVSRDDIPHNYISRDYMYVRNPANGHTMKFKIENK